jgi:hypothetical protein
MMLVLKILAILLLVDYMNTLHVTITTNVQLIIAIMLKDVIMKLHWIAMMITSVPTIHVTQILVANTNVSAVMMITNVLLMVVILVSVVPMNQ